MSTFRPDLFQGNLAPLTLPDFRRLFVSNYLWWGTRFMEFIVVGWLVLEMTDFAWQVAVIGFYRSAPSLIIGFVSGPIIDRVGRRKIILAGQALNLLIYALIALLLWFDQLALWQLAAGSMLIGVAWALDWPARRSLIPDLVGKDKTVDAMLLESFGQNIARISGPFTAGLLINSFGAFGVFTAMAGVAFLTIFILLGLSDQPSSQPKHAVKSSPLANITEGLKYVRHNQAILATLLITMGMNFLAFPYRVLLPVFARDILQQGPVGLGILGSAAGVGAFMGIFMISYVRRYISNGWIFATGSALHTVAIFAFAFSGIYSLSVALLFLAGIGHACFGIMQSSIILLSASDEMRSRTMGTLVLAIGMGPLGQLQIGASSDLLGAAWAVRLSAFLAFLSIVIVAIALPGLRHKPESRKPARASALA